MSQEFCILVSASPLKTQAHLTAIRFVETLCSQKIPIANVFFYQDAVLVANSLTTPPSDEPHIRECWVKLAKKNGFELQTCIAASLRRGMLDKQLAAEYQQSAPSVNSDFVMSGLGQLASAMSDGNNKLIHFN
ncbi:MAG: sulfurtransferase complex subunit TusD [Kangiellaceae bacterium]|nr:sulfurtransferase complex subunit TusD [Kangiellaceae bacterium]